MEKNYIRIGLPTSNSELVKTFENVGYKVTMVCGNQTFIEYLVDNVPEGVPSIVALEDYTGRCKRINTKYVVKSEPVIFATFLYTVGTNFYNEVIIAYNPDYDGVEFVNEYIPFCDGFKYNIISDKTWEKKN